MNPTLLLEVCLEQTRQFVVLKQANRRLTVDVDCVGGRFVKKMLTDARKGSTPRGDGIGFATAPIQTTIAAKKIAVACRVT